MFSLDLRESDCGELTVFQVSSGHSTSVTRGRLKRNHAIMVVVKTMPWI